MFTHSQFENTLQSLQAASGPSLDRERLEQALYVVGSVIDIGNTMLEIRKSGSLEVEIKSDNSPITKADKAAREHFKENLPRILDYPILSEEANNQALLSGKDNLWIVDELDGTASFRSGHDNFGPCVALYENGMVEIGVTGFPAQNSVFFAIRGAGAFLFDTENETVTQLKTREPEQGSFLFHGFFKADQEEVQTMERLLSSESEDFVYQPAGASQKFTDVAQGICDGAGGAATLLNVWDIAANALIVSEAGGEIIDLDTGTPLRIDSSQTSPYRIVALGKSRALNNS